jgi:hypothetical protein
MSRNPNDWLKYIVTDTKARAKRKNLQFDLDREFIESLFIKQDGRCYWLGIELKSTQSKLTPNQPSIDRLDNSKGYTKDNVVLACAFANLGRSTVSQEEFRLFIQDQLYNTNELHHR